MSVAAAVLQPSRRLRPTPAAVAIVAGALVSSATMAALSRSFVGSGHPSTIMQSVASLRPAAQIISSDALPHVAGKRVTTMVVEFPPSGFSPPHHHGGSVTVCVLEGAIRSQLAGGPSAIYRPGETFFEPQDVTHLVAENISATAPARILAIFVADEGATLTTYHE